MNIIRKKRLRTCFLIVMIIALFIGWHLIFSKYINRGYDSLESAFRYHEGNDSEVILVLEGSASAYVVGYNEKAQVTNIFLKTDNYWKDVSFPNSVTNYGLSNLHYSIKLSKYNNEDCYISVMVRKNEDAIVYDVCGSEFITLPVQEELGSLYKVGFYGYIEDYNEDYWINIGDSKITID